MKKEQRRLVFQRRTALTKALRQLPPALRIKALNASLDAQLEQEYAQALEEVGAKRLVANLKALQLDPVAVWLPELGLMAGERDDVEDELKHLVKDLYQTERTLAQEQEERRRETEVLREQMVREQATASTQLGQMRQARDELRGDMYSALRAAEERMRVRDGEERKTGQLCPEEQAVKLCAVALDRHTQVPHIALQMIEHAQGISTQTETDTYLCRGYVLFHYGLRQTLGSDEAEIDVWVPDEGKIVKRIPRLLVQTVPLHSEQDSQRPRASVTFYYDSTQATWQFRVKNGYGQCFDGSLGPMIEGAWYMQHLSPTEASDDVPGDPMFKCRLYRRLLQQATWREALVAFEEAVQKDRRNQIARAYQVRTLLALGEHTGVGAALLDDNLELTWRVHGRPAPLGGWAVRAQNEINREMLEHWRAYERQLTARERVHAKPEEERTLAEDYMVWRYPIEGVKGTRARRRQLLEMEGQRRQFSSEADFSGLLTWLRGYVAAEDVSLSSELLGGTGKMVKALQGDVELMRALLSVKDQLRGASEEAFMSRVTGWRNGGIPVGVIARFTTIQMQEREVAEKREERKDGEVTGLRREVVNQREQLTGKDEALAYQRTQLGEKDAELADQRAQLAQRDRVIADKDAKMARAFAERDHAVSDTARRDRDWQQKWDHLAAEVVKYKRQCAKDFAEGKGERTEASAAESGETAGPSADDRAGSGAAAAPRARAETLTTHGEAAAAGFWSSAATSQPRDIPVASSAAGAGAAAGHRLGESFA